MSVARHQQMIENARYYADDCSLLQRVVNLHLKQVQDVLMRI